MTRRRKILLGVSLMAVIAVLYPAFVLGYTWKCVVASDLPGGRHGPLDGYRHALASAVVSYTLHPAVVPVVNLAMESQGKDSNRMDRHNNLLGASIGDEVGEFGEIEPLVRALAESGSSGAPLPGRMAWPVSYTHLTLPTSIQV